MSTAVATKTRLADGNPRYQTLLRDGEKLRSLAVATCELITNSPELAEPVRVMLKAMTKLAKDIACEVTVWGVEGMERELELVAACCYGANALGLRYLSDREPDRDELEAAVDLALHAHENIQAVWAFANGEEV